MLSVDDTDIPTDRTKRTDLCIGEIAPSANISAPADTGAGQQNIVLYGIISGQSGTTVDISLVRNPRMTSQSIIKLHEKHNDTTG
jgi:hypothetical protein